MMETTTTTKRLLTGNIWVLILVPLLVLGVVLAYLITTGGGLRELAGPPIEQLKISKITLPEPNVIRVEVINDGPQTLSIPQVIVDDAFWNFSARPSTTIPRLGQATFTIPYPWVQGEAHRIALVSSLGTLFEGEIPVAQITPSPSSDLFAHFGLIGLYVGIVPIALGMLWYPFMRRLSSTGLRFILALTVGLLVYLAINTWLDALEFASDLPSFLQGIPVIIIVALIALGVLITISQRRKANEQALETSYRIALGIGLHNLGEGLAIGAAFSLGQSALATFLVVGFTLHNITEGVGIVAPVVRQAPRLRHFILLVILAGLPAILGTWLGGFAFNPALATIFLAIGLGAILQVIWEVGRLIIQDSVKLGLSPMNWPNLAGLVSGMAIMYFTAFFVKV